MKNSYRRGFYWAAGALLSGEETPESMDARLYWNDPIPSSLSEDAFDCGAAAALAAYLKLTNETKN